ARRRACLHMRIVLTFFWILVMALSVAVFTATAVRAFFYSPDSEIHAPTIVSAETVYGPEMHPDRLVIPAIGIDAAVQHVGINGSGNMATPTNFQDVGWYKYGVVPGGRGSAVIAGHVDNGLGLSGVFKRLPETQPGDDIYVTAEDGTRTHFVVTSVRSYPYTEVPEDIVFNPRGSSRLNLITCEGSWLPESKTYDQRLVVFAKLAGE
ncbi:MAG: class F sortase, partial [Minisyncoccia bacterium]